MATASVRVMMISDTHSQRLENIPGSGIDVLIHCGDITEGSQLNEFSSALETLLNIDAPLKIVTPGNHDWTMDQTAYGTLRADALRIGISADEFRSAYGDFGDARAVLTSPRAITAGVRLFDCSAETLLLRDGAMLRIATSPYTPAENSNMGFQYERDRPPDWHFATKTVKEQGIGQDIDILITHGPPRGILDVTDSGRIGCQSLFEAVAHARPKVHCFGHVHRGWGARLVQWRDEMPDEISHFTVIDNNKSQSLTNLARAPQHEGRTSVLLDEPHLPGKQTLFVNAALKATAGQPQHLPFIVTMELPLHSASIGELCST